MKTVHILFFSGQDTVGRFIELVTRSTYSHVGIGLVNDDGLMDYYESVRTGVRVFRGLDAADRLEQVSASTTLRVSDADAQIMRTFLEGEVGKKYPLTVCVCIFIAQLTNYRHQRLVDYLTDRESAEREYICSGLVATALAMGHQLNVPEPAMASPENLAEWFPPTPVHK